MQCFSTIEKIGSSFVQKLCLKVYKVYKVMHQYLKYIIKYKVMHQYLKYII